MSGVIFKLKEFIKGHKKNIIVSTVVLIVLFAVSAGGKTGFAYYSAKKNVKYSTAQLQNVALSVKPGTVVDVKKRLNFHEDVYVYEYYIKDSSNMLDRVSVNSEYGTIEQGHGGFGRHGNMYGQHERGIHESENETGFKGDKFHE